MNKCADLHTDTAIQCVLRKYFDIPNAKIFRTENGKPYIDGNQIFFSVSHTKNALFLVFSDENTGLDAEAIDRNVHYTPIVKKFCPAERKEITSTELFLKHWTAKEATVKWLGGTLAKDLYKLDFVNGNMQYGETSLPLVFVFLPFEDCILCVCAEHLNNVSPYFEKIILEGEMI